MRCGELSSGARLLFWEMSQWLSDDQDVCVRSHDQLAKAIGACRNSVIRWLHELRAAGVVTSEPSGHVYAYTLHFDAVASALPADR